MIEQLFPKLIGYSFPEENNKFVKCLCQFAPSWTDRRLNEAKVISDGAATWLNVCYCCLTVLPFPDLNGLGHLGS